MKNCPRCENKINLIGKTLVCSCGWTYSKKTETSDITVVLGLILAFTLVAGSLFHFFQWGSHGLSIFFANADKKVQICMNLKKYDCVEESYNKLFQETGDISILEKLGEFQFKRDKFSAADQTYNLYFSKKGKSYKAAYYYAHSLSKTGDIESAIKYFDSIVRSQPHLLMVTVVESYLEMLISNNRIDKAKEVLSWIDKKNKGAVNTSDQIQVWRKKYSI